MTELEYVGCALCGGNNTELVIKVYNTHDAYSITNQSFNLVKCRNCGLLYINPRPTKEEISRFYPEKYYSVKITFLTKIINLINYFLKLAQIRRVIKYKKQGRLLDLGCGVGEFLGEMKRRGFEVYGVDPSSQACKLAQGRLKNIFNTELEECHFPDNYFDVVTLWHVLEHLPNPNITLKEIHRVLKKDGILILETPNIDSLLFKIFKKNWFHLDIPRHLYHWSSKTIRGILNKHKFRVFKISYFSLGFPLSLFHSFSNLLNDHEIRSLFRQLILMVFSLLLIILTILSRILPFKGEILIVYVRVEI